MKKGKGVLKKRKTIYARMVRMVVTVDIMMFFLLFSGFTTAKQVMVAEDPQKYLKSYNVFCLVVLLVFAAILTVIFKRIMKSIRVGFKELTVATQCMAEGKVDINIPLNGLDEFGDLFREYNKLIQASKEQAVLAEQVANEDLSMEVTPRGSEDVLGKALQKMVRETNSSLTDIKNSVETVYDKSSEVAEASQNLAQGSTEQASAIEEITASVAEVTQDTKNNASQANDAAALIDTTLKNVIDGNEKMNNMMEAIIDINTSSENISKIIKTIDDIAFQTNILALNAAVEAARAGEAGRGFAVVAEEVRNLAAKSAEAASETSELIEKSIKITESGTSIARDTAKMFEVITKDVKTSAALISQIADASNNQVITLEQIDIAVDQVSQVVQNNSAISETCAEASSDLSDKARMMKNLISKYKLE